ncbi:MAG: NnrS family protein [Acidobacteriia bacterium]|nr:NnrS family protein [Terriglobia bacterium]
MSQPLTRIETRAGRRLAPEEIYSLVAARESRLSRLLITYITAGLIFMLLPGTFLGVWNLLAISSRQAADSVSPAWIQAHGHAQIFGWIGTFILGIGFYSIPKLRRLDPFALGAGWTAWGLWTTGVALRWFTGVWGWQWRIALPVSAALELAAFLIFLRCVSGHRPQDSGKPAVEPWVWVVIAASAGLLLTLVVNLGAASFLAFRGSSPDLPSAFDQRFLVLQTWGFLVPFVWGFSAKWLSVFLGLRPVRGGVLLCALALNSAGVLAALAGWMVAAVSLLLAGMLAAVFALGIVEKPRQPAKVRGVSSLFPVFIRVAYVWGVVAAALGIWAALAPDPSGIWGASRHALTVGFLALMVFGIGQRVLPAFSGMHVLFSTKLMALALVLLAAGCLLRVSSEILAYQGIAQAAWRWLPVSALTEMTAVTLFAGNVLVSFHRRRPSLS